MSKKYVYMFSEGNAGMRNLLGGKGANLAEMTNLGLPVPYGFTISTEACTEYNEGGKKLTDEMIDQIEVALAKLEEIGFRFGETLNREVCLVLRRASFRDFCKGLEVGVLPDGASSDPKPVVMCGDFNVAHEEIDLKNPKTNRRNAGFTDEERACFGKVLESGFIDTFRYFYPDVEGRYSWWSYRFKAREKNAGWRIDYFITSPQLKDKLEGAEIHSEIMGSDHCPVELQITL